MNDVISDSLYQVHSTLCLLKYDCLEIVINKEKFYFIDKRQIKQRQTLFSVSCRQKQTFIRKGSVINFIKRETFLLLFTANQNYGMLLEGEVPW